MFENFTKFLLSAEVGITIFFLTLAVLRFGYLFNSFESYNAKKNNGYFEIVPLPSTYVFSLGVLSTFIWATCNVLKSGQFLTIHLHENSLNEIIGFLLLTVFWAGLIYYFYIVHIVRQSFNEREIIATIPFIGQRHYEFSKLEKVRFKPFTYFKLGNKKFILHGLMSGEAQLVNLIDQKLFNLFKPLFSVHDDKIFEDIIGKTVLVNIFYNEENFFYKMIFSGIGTILSTGKEGIIVGFENEKKLYAAANLAALRTTGGDPEMVATWFVNSPNEIHDLKI